MKKLTELTKDISILEIHGSSDRTISEISIDSRTCGIDSVYIAISGGVYDGHAFINHAIESGATVIICEQLPNIRTAEVTYLVVANTRSATGFVAAAFYDYPSREVQLFGVTGTNGKTTVATLVYQLLRFVGKSAAVLSTAGDFFNETSLIVNRQAGTSVEVIEFNRILRQLADAGCQYCAFEVSSHALDQDRIAGLEIQVAAYTNLSQDHLDYHHTMEAYAAAKKKLFDSLAKDSYAIINRDDPYGEYMSRDTQAHLYTYSLDQLDKCIYTAGGTDMVLEKEKIHSPLLGQFNVYNVLAAIESLVAFGFDKREILHLIPQLQGVSGRAEIVNHPTGITGIIDYAHTPDGLENILTSLRAVMGPDQRLITIIGCGGDRDTTKRKPMGDIARTYSDYAIFTSDNPRTEDPEHIIDMMCEGLGESESWTRITDRHEAIAHAIQHAHQNDVVLMAGKGHEEYQEINGVKYPFRDKDVFLG